MERQKISGVNNFVEVDYLCSVQASDNSNSNSHFLPALNHPVTNHRSYVVPYRRLRGPKLPVSMEGIK
jgi:hypothetical protein